MFRVDNRRKRDRGVRILKQTEFVLYIEHLGDPLLDHIEGDGAVLDRLHHRALVHVVWVVIVLHVASRVVEEVDAVGGKLAHMVGACTART